MIISLVMKSIGMLIVGIRGNHWHCGDGLALWTRPLPACGGTGKLIYVFIYV